MYDEHFGLTGRPFQLTPDPAFWFETATHRRAMAYLGYGLAQGEGFIVITGDIGAGKTTLVGHLLATLDREALNPIKLVSTAIDASDLLRIVATQLGVNPAGLQKAELLVAIERGLHMVARTGRRTLLVVDEAQALPVAALEELRMLSNFQAGGHALLQIVLLGQPEFRAAMQGSEGLEQLRQRVIAIHHLDPMGQEEVAAYLAHRLSVVGWNGRPDFVESSFAAFYRATDGVPRRLNQLANRVMLHAAVENIEVIDGDVVEVVAADLFADLPTLGVPAPVSAPAVIAASRTEAEPMHANIVLQADPEPAALGEPKPEPVAIAIKPSTQTVEPKPAPASPFARASWIADPVFVEPAPLRMGAPAEDLVNPFAPSTDPMNDEPAVEVAADEAPAHRPEELVNPFVPSINPTNEEPAEAADDQVPAHRPIVSRVRSWLDPKSAPIAVASEPIGDMQPAPTLSLVPPNETSERLAALEARLEEQDAALRRVLTLLVDWVENDQPPRSAEPLGYVPIRGAAA